MGQSSAETVREIADIRSRMDSDFSELERRLPQPGLWAKRLVGILVGGGIGALVLRAIIKAARQRGIAGGPDPDQLVLIRVGDLRDLAGNKKIKFAKPS
jgi:hypothetical protein